MSRNPFLPVVLLAFALQGLAQGPSPLDSVILTESELPSGCKAITGEYPVDNQSAIFFSYPDYQKQLLPALKDKRAQSLDCSGTKGTLYYYAYSSAADVQKVVSFVRPLMWGGDGPTPRHPQRILSGGSILVIASFKETPPALLSAVTKKLDAGNAPETKPSPAEGTFREGLTRFQERDLRQAEKLFRKAVAADPDHLPAQFFLGTALFQQQKFKEAVAPYAAARRLDDAQRRFDPTQRRVLNDQLGMAYGISGDLKTAEAHFRSAIQEDPEYALYHYNLACTYAEMGDLDKTLSALEEALKRRANVVAGGSFPDPRTDDSFQRFVGNPRFQKLLAQHGFALTGK